VILLKPAKTLDLNFKYKIKSHLNLKVPKREIFDCSDFPDFYTIKSLRMGVWVLK
jgi:hypothetical protein